VTAHSARRRKLPPTISAHHPEGFNKESFCVVCLLELAAVRERVERMEAVWVGARAPTQGDSRGGRACLVYSADFGHAGSSNDFHSGDGDDGSVFSSIVGEESTILRENVRNILEVSGLTNLIKLPLCFPDPLRETIISSSSCTPSCMLQNIGGDEEPECCFAELFEKGAVIKEAFDDKHEDHSIIESAESRTDTEIEMEYEDPSLFAGYPFVRLSYSTEEKALSTKREE